MTRTEFNTLLRREAGGRCSTCGLRLRRARVTSKSGRTYYRSNLQFHHVPGTEKLGEVTAMPTRAAARLEAAKCQLLCADCHLQWHKLANFFGSLTTTETEGTDDNGIPY